MPGRDQDAAVQAAVGIGARERRHPRQREVHLRRHARRADVAGAPDQVRPQRHRIDELVSARFGSVAVTTAVLQRLLAAGQADADGPAVVGAGSLSPRRRCGPRRRTPAPPHQCIGERGGAAARVRRLPIAPPSLPAESLRNTNAVPADQTPMPVNRIPRDATAPTTASCSRPSARSRRPPSGSTADDSRPAAAPRPRKSAAQPQAGQRVAERRALDVGWCRGVHVRRGARRAPGPCVSNAAYPSASVADLASPAAVRAARPRT